MPGQLVDYIKRQREKGFSDEQIKGKLITAGYRYLDVESSFSILNQDNEADLQNSSNNQEIQTQENKNTNPPKSPDSADSDDYHKFFFWSHKKNNNNEEKSKNQVKNIVQEKSASPAKSPDSADSDDYHKFFFWSHKKNNNNEAKSIVQEKSASPLKNTEQYKSTDQDKSINQDKSITQDNNTGQYKSKNQDKSTAQTGSDERIIDIFSNKQLLFFLAFVGIIIIVILFAITPEFFGSMQFFGNKDSGIGIVYKEGCTFEVRQNTYFCRAILNQNTGFCAPIQNQDDRDVCVSIVSFLSAIKNSNPDLCKNAEIIPEYNCRAIIGNRAGACEGLDKADKELCLFLQNLKIAAETQDAGFCSKTRNFPKQLYVLMPMCEELVLGKPYECSNYFEKNCLL